MLRIILATLIAIVCSTSSVFSSEAAEREKLLNTINASLDVLYDECCADLSLEAKQAKVRAAFEGNYDLTVMIRRVIGRNWRLMSEEEQNNVLELVKQLVVKAYVEGLDGKTRPEVELGKVISVTDARMEIESTVTLDGDIYYVTYRLGRMSSGWQIYDIVAENISIVSNYRQQIDDHFRKGNGAGLVARLEELLEQDVIDEDTKI